MVAERDDQRWQAVLARDPGQDGVFVYAVRSTGIYCRPSCASRRPRWEQVRLFPSPQAAEQEGFRPCRRCRPQEGGAADAQLNLVRRVCRQIEADSESVTLTDLSRHAGISPRQLQRLFKRLLGITPRQYADACRLHRFKSEVRKSDEIGHALYAAGYGSSSRLYELAPARLGMTPARYRRGGEGAQIRYTIQDCPLGRLLVAATERGVCAISLGDRDQDLETALRREYPAATFQRSDTALRERVAAVLAHLQGARPRLDLPLDIQGTAFQRRVWDALGSIPYGQTRSYCKIAAEIGRPTATRAVGRACGANPVALAIPCHRAVREDGGLGGYRWGIARKQALLENERTARTVTAPPPGPPNRSISGGAVPA